MSVTIPLKEVVAKWMKEPGFAEACAQARRELDEEIVCGAVFNPKLIVHFEEIEEELMKDQNFADGVKLAELRLEKRFTAEQNHAAA